MTDTTKPPKRPTDRGGDRPRSRPTGIGIPRPGDPQRRQEPVPPGDDARIAKVMARAGLCSRRDAEGWIAAGRVAVNGRIIDSPALNVASHDRITVDGVALPERDATRLFLFHKPRGLVTTARDPEGRPTIFDNLPLGLPRVVSVGRLDINSEGLMLLTNDGGLARVLELPATGWLRRYRVRANGAIDQAALDALKSGVTIDGVDYAGIEATLDRVQGANVWLTMGLREGKNREIKRVLESLKLAVTRLIRVSFGPFQLGELVAGAAESVPTRVLRDQLGPDLAAKAGVDFAPREEAPSGRGARPDRVSSQRPTRGEAPSARAHVSALRAAREAAAGEGRHRIERAATADRKGRAVKIERVIPVGPGADRDPERAETRNARRFAAEKRDAAPGRRAAAGRGDEGERPRASRSGFRGKPRIERDGGSMEGSRRERETGFGDRRGRSPGPDAPARQGRVAAFAEKPRTAGTTRFGDPSRGERASTSAETRRNLRGKSEARTGGFGSERPATGRNRPKGFKDPGGGPAGGPQRGGRPQRGAPSGGAPGGGAPAPRGGGRPKGGGRP